MRSAGEASEGAPEAVRALRLGALAWPIFVESALRVSIGTVDTLMVSRVSDGAVAALGVAGQVVSLALMLLTCVSAGTGVLLTHHLGAGDRRGAARLAGSALAVNVALGAAVGVAVALLAGPLLRLVQLPAELLPLARPFLAIVGGTVALEAASLVLSAALRAHGHTREAMAVAVGQNLLNAGGNAVALFGLFGLPRLGVPGVALSTTVSRAVACAALAVLLRRRTGIRLDRAALRRAPADDVRRVVALGLPIAGENVCWTLAWMAVTSFVARLGGASLAAQSYAVQLGTWAGLLGSSVAFASQIRVGHRVGSGELGRARAELAPALRGALGLVVGAELVLALVAPRLVALFSRDAAVIATASAAVRLGLLTEPARATNLVVIQALRAAGDARFPVRLAVASMWGVQVPLAWLLALRLGLGVPGVWLAVAADEGLRAMVVLARWRRGTWMTGARRSLAGVRRGA